MREDRKHTAKQAGITEGNVPSVTIHNVHILDASGSMGGGKYTNALKGINSEIMAMRSNSEGMTQTIIEFTSGHTHQSKLTTHYFMTPAENCTAIVGSGANGGTPLYQTVGETIEKLLIHVKPTDKVLVKIFTDGEENESKGKYVNTGTRWAPKSEELTRIIKMAEDNHNFTITFMGTKGDVENMISNIGLIGSNTLVHDNTEFGVQNSYMTSTVSTMKYRKDVSRGVSQDELKKGFFKKVSTDQDLQNNAQIHKGLAKPKDEEKTTN